MLLLFVISLFRYSCDNSANLHYYVLLIFIDRSHDVLGLAMACSNTFGLVTGAFLLGFGLSEIPKSIWRNADWTTRQKVLSHKVAKMAVKLDDAHQELSNAIVVSAFCFLVLEAISGILLPCQYFVLVNDQLLNSLLHINFVLLRIVLSLLLCIHSCSHVGFSGQVM